MMYFSTISAAVLAVRPLIAHADDGFLSIPASEFSGNGTVYNNTGTAAFAPILRPEPATVTFLSCRGKAKFKKEVIFTLRRNQPQQANVDMTTVRIGLGETGFVTKNINRIAQGKVDNRRFNYFIVADSSKVGGNQPGNRATVRSAKHGMFGGLLPHRLQNAIAADHDQV